MKGGTVMEKSNWVDKYLKTNYIGCVAGDYEHSCHLYFKDINSFIQNVGLYADVEIIRLEDGDILLNTFGNFINRIWPTMSYDMRSTTEMTNNINYIADNFQEMREKDGDFPKPTSKVEKFMREVLGHEVVEQNEKLHEDYDKAVETGLDEDEIMGMLLT